MTELITFVYMCEEISYNFILIQRMCAHHIILITFPLSSKFYSTN